MTQLTDSMVLEALETMAAQFPWDTVRISIERKPEGDCEFTVGVNENKKLGFDYECGWGSNPQSAVQHLIERSGERDPEKARNRKIAELEDQIRKLNAVIIGMPPYRPGTRLAEKTDKKPIDVETVAA